MNPERQNDELDIFGSLLSNEQRKGNEKAFKQKQILLIPTIVDDSSKLIEDRDICDFFIINSELFVVKESDNFIQILKLSDDRELQAVVKIVQPNANPGISSDPMLDKRVSTPSPLHIIHHYRLAASQSSISEISKSLFCSLFDVDNALNKSLILVFGDQHGRIFKLPFALDAQSEVSCVLGVQNLFFDLKQPLLDILKGSIREIVTQSDESVRRKDGNEDNLISVNKALKGENVLMIVGIFGRIIVLLPQAKELRSLAFSTCHVPGPVSFAVAKDDILLSATHEKLNLLRLSVCVNTEDGSSTKVQASLIPAYTIAIPIASICKSVALSTNVESIMMSFYCVCTNGHVTHMDIVSEDATVCKKNRASDVEYLLENLEKHKSDLGEWCKLNEGRDVILEDLMTTASLTVDILSCFKGNEQTGWHTSNPRLYCKITDVLLVEDGILYVDITLHNDSDCILPANWKLQCVSTARKQTLNSTYGELKTLSKLLAVEPLRPKSKANYKYSFLLSELQIFLPMDLDFRLVIPPPADSSEHALALHNATSHIVLPLNICSVSGLDICRIKDGDFYEFGTNVSGINPYFHQRYSICSCCRDFSISDALVTSGKDSKPPKTLPIPPAIMQRFSKDRMPKSAKDFQIDFLSCLFPCKMTEIHSHLNDSILLEMPCKQVVKLTFVFCTNFKQENTLEIPKMQLEGSNVALLLMVHSAILSRLEVRVSS